MSAGVAPLIVHVIHRLDFGGLENGLVNLVNHLPPERYRHSIVCLAGFNPRIRARILRSDVEVLSLDKQPGKDPAAYLRMWRVLRQRRPAVVHTRNLGTVDMQWVAALAAVPHRVHGEHGWEVDDPRGLSRRSLRIRRACRPVIHRYVPMSQDIARWLERDVGVPADRIRQLYSGVDVERFRPGGPRATDAAGAAEGAGAGRGPTLGTIGRLDPVKNQEALLEAFARLRQRHAGLRLVIVGDGPLRGHLQSRARSLGVAGDVTFTGSRTDTPELLRSFDVFVLPSVNEGISNTILEAMACGVPVVASGVGGNPELVVDGACGSLYDPADPQALQQAILPYLGDPALRERQGRAARERVVQNFSLHSMVGRYLALYDELLAASPARGGQGRG
jgi:sugar transferase (PEP-CTERM/EpsH1 system associated)